MPDFDVFLSYHWRDHERAEALAKRLGGVGLRAFLDRWYLTPGTSWLKALESALASCNAVAICIGAEMGPWQLREQYRALEHQLAAEGNGTRFPIIPVLFPGSEPPLGLLHQSTWVDLRHQFDDRVHFAILAKAIRGEQLDASLQAAAQQTVAQLCPYRDLLYFREEDAEFFFGREAATRQLFEALDQHSLVATVGASGSGKSSVVRAGLIPALRKSLAAVWEIATLVPGDRPLHALAAVILPMLEPQMSEVAQLGEINRLAGQLGEGKIALRDVVERVLAQQPGTERLLLVVDQWEELFTLTQDKAARRRFIDSLLEATERSPLAVVLTLRGDFFGRAVTTFRSLSDRVQRAQVNLGPMKEAEVRRAIEEPARKVGLSFEAGLVDAIFADLGEEPSNLPLLEFTLRQLWAERQGGVLHKEAYESMGRLTGSLARKADALYKQSSAPERELLQRVFTRLVRPVHGEQDTRCRADAAEFGASAASLIKKLRDGRLLVTSKTDTGNETLEIVHDALVRSWELLRRWADAERQFIVWQGDLNAAATKWRDSQRSTDLLLRGLPLAQAQDWQRRKPDVCAKLEREFVSASARRKTLRRGAAIGAAALVAITTGCLVVETVDERELADLARARAEQLVNFMIFDLRDKLRAIGRLDLMDSVTARVNEYYEKLGPRDVAHHAEYQRAANLTSQGDLAIAQGNLGKAREAYEQALAITEHLAKAEPANSYGQSVLGVSHIRLGDLEAAAGQLDAARKDYEQTLAISERLAKANPADSGSQQGLWLSYWKLGDVEVAAGQLDAARTDYEQDLAIAERLAKANPADSGSQQGLWLSYWKLGDVEVATGHLEAGRTDYEQALAIAEQLAKADPTNSGWQRELSVSHMKIGSVSSQQNQRSEALQHFNKALAISARFAKLDPSNAVWKHDLDWLKAEISALKGRKER